MAVNTEALSSGEESLFMRCVERAELYPGSPTTDGRFISDGATNSGQYQEYGDEFEQVMILSD